METIKVKRLENRDIEAADVVRAMDEAGVEFHAMDQLNWSNVAPYKPEVKFRIAHNGGNILLQYVVREEYVRAVADADNGSVWEDSCVEFFVAFNPDNYYNLECNCAATILCGAGRDRNERERASNELLSAVKRHTTIDGRGFDVRKAPEEWSVKLVVPAELFFRDSISNLSGVEARGNFYKCGDMLPAPHFLSFNKVDVPTPNFHLPEFFIPIIFE